MGIQMIMDSKTMPHTIVYNRTLDLKANEMWFFANAISTVLQKKRHTIRRVGLWISVHPIGWPPFTYRKKAWCYEKQWVTGLIGYLRYFDDLLQCYIFSQ